MYRPLREPGVCGARGVPAGRRAEARVSLRGVVLLGVHSGLRLRRQNLLQRVHAPPGVLPLQEEPQNHL